MNNQFGIVDFENNVFDIKSTDKTVQWDSTKKQLSLSRDTVGKNQIYYFIKGKKLIFASDINSILKQESITPKLNTKLLTTYLSLGCFPSPHTVFENIYKLRPGQTLVFDKEKTKAFIHFRPNFKTTNSTLGQDKKELNKLFEASVQKNINDNAGFLVSGGIDSSAVVAYASKHLEKINSFSVVFEDKNKSEEKYQQLIVDKFSTNHNSIYFQEDDIFKLDKAISHLKEPNSDIEFLPLFLLCKSASEKVNYLISGDGGDELFAGYDYYNELLNSKEFSYPLFRNARFHIKFSNFNNSHIKSIFDYYLLPNLSPLRQAMFLDFKFCISEAGLPMIKTATNANSLKIKFPLLDKKIINFSFKLKQDRLIYNNTKKYLLKQILKDKIPSEILNKKKQGFSFGLKNVNNLIDLKDIKEFIYCNEIKNPVLKKLLISPSDKKHYLYARANLVLWNKSKTLP